MVVHGLDGLLLLSSAALTAPVLLSQPCLLDQPV